MQMLTQILWIIVVAHIASLNVGARIVSKECNEPSLLAFSCICSVFQKVYMSGLENFAFQLVLMGKQLLKFCQGSTSYLSYSKL